MRLTTTIKNIVVCLWLLSAFSIVIAQTPPSDLNGNALKQWLKTNYYDGKHTELGYSDARYRMYSDIDNISNSIVCVYSGYQKTWSTSNTSTNPSPVNCEHTVPQSFFGQSEPMRSDIHHLFPTYENWNSERSNNPFGEIDDNNTNMWMFLSGSQSSKPTTNIDAYSESNGSVFEPREDHKGNCARAIFYFFTMYPTKVGEISTVGDLNTLYQWHINDPVDQDEIERNDRIEYFQGNSNPFVEHPELVERAWITEGSGLLAPTTSIETSSNKLTINWSAIDNAIGYKVYKSVDNSIFTELTSVLSDVLKYEDASVVENTIYYYYVIAYNNDGSSANSNVVSSSLPSSSGGANELFFSEYVEGSSYDKVLEIANYTNDAIDLSDYSIMKQSNGAGAWGSELNLSGTLVSGKVFVVCHYQANTAIKSVADLIEPSNSWTLSFNGNDPIGLFRNGTLIDIIGTFNSSSKFGENSTLIRKATVSGPSTTYDSNEWKVEAQGVISNLGIHTINGSTSISNDFASLKDKFKVYPNPADETITIALEDGVDIEDHVKCKIIALSGKIVYSENLSNNGLTFKEELNISNLNEGVYLLVLEIGSERTIQKIIIQ